MKEGKPQRRGGSTNKSVHIRLNPVSDIFLEFSNFVKFSKCFWQSIPKYSSPEDKAVPIKTKYSILQDNVTISVVLSEDISQVLWLLGLPDPVDGDEGVVGNQLLHCHPAQLVKHRVPSCSWRSIKNNILQTDCILPTREDNSTRHY